MRNTIEYYERRTARFGGMLAALLLAALPVHAQTGSTAWSEFLPEAEPVAVPVAIMRFYGDTDSVNTSFREATGEDVENLPAFSADIVPLTGPYGAYQLADEPPPPELTRGKHYALTGALYPDEMGRKHLQLWLWDVSIPALVYTDEMVCDELESGREFVTLMVEWIFSHITPDEIDARLAEMAYEAELAEASKEAGLSDQLPVPPDPQHWREKLLYIRTSFDYGIIAYQVVDSSQEKPTYTDTEGNDGEPIPTKYRQDSRSPFGFTLGLEFQFFRWMSLEAYGRLSFGDISGLAFAPAAGLELKFPLKPANSFMIEPYAVVEFPFNSGGGIQAFSPLGVGAGLQFGVKGGNVGAFFLDAQFIYNLGDIYIIEPEDLKRNAHWTRWVMGFGIGYKVGFYNRNKADK